MEIFVLAKYETNGMTVPDSAYSAHDTGCDNIKTEYYVTTEDNYNNQEIDYNYQKIDAKAIRNTTVIAKFSKKELINVLDQIQICLYMDLFKDIHRCL